MVFFIVNRKVVHNRIEEINYTKRKSYDRTLGCAKQTSFASTTSDQIVRSLQTLKNKDH